MGCATSSATTRDEVKDPDPSTPGPRTPPNSRVEDGVDLEAVKLAPAEEVAFKTDANEDAEAANAIKPCLDPQERLFREVLASGAPKDASQPERFEESLPKHLASKGVERRPSTIGVGFGDYVRLHEDEFAAVLRLEQQPGWTFKKREAGVNIYTWFDEERGLVSFKGITEMACGGLKTGILYLLDHFFNPENRSQFDEMCLGGSTIEQNLPYYRVAHLKFKAPAARGVIMDRDVLILCRFRFEPDGGMIASMASTVHQQAPEVVDFVRLDFQCGGYVIRPTEREDVLQVSYFGTVDPRGWIPSFVKNLAAWKQTLVLAKFKAKHGV